MRILVRRLSLIVGFCSVTLFYCRHLALAQSDMELAVVTIDNATPGDAIPDNFVGLSYEVSALSQKTPIDDNSGLINILGVLNRKCSFRLGGNTSDRVRPSTARIQSAARFAKRVCRGVPFLGVAWKTIAPNQTEVEQAESDAIEVSIFAKAFGSSNFYVQIGNEPNVYPNITVETYLLKWKLIEAYIDAKVPGTLFAGPDMDVSVNVRPFPFLRQFVAGSRGKISALSLHNYIASGTGDLIVDYSQATRGATRDRESGVAESISNDKAVIGANLPLYLTESASLSGSTTEANTLAGANLNLQEMIIFALSRFNGEFIHGGDAWTSANSYWPVATSDGENYDPQAALYAMLAMQTVVGGRVLPSFGLPYGHMIASSVGKKLRRLS